MLVYIPSKIPWKCPCPHILASSGHSFLFKLRQLYTILFLKIKLKKPVLICIYSKVSRAFRESIQAEGRIPGNNISE